MANKNFINNDFADVVLNRHSVKKFEKGFKIPHSELLQMVQQAVRAPSAINSQPWHFLIVDSDAGKEKLDEFMVGPDKALSKGASATIIVLGDTKWYRKDHFDKTYEHYPKEASDFFHKMLDWWVPQLLDSSKDELGSGMDEMLAVNNAIVTMQFVLIARAHGYDANIADDFKREGLVKAFGLDDDRYKPMLFFVVGKADPKEIPEKTYRLPAADVTTFA
ncbi:nitroreductase family protein [Oenococcus alcoholitolerans]|uniref:nitroreductase family protein n=1 Tax=Oenococcus alcoholitolerans TaxID=931074 RepID=UPI003F70E2F4